MRSRRGTRLIVMTLAALLAAVFFGFADRASATHGSGYWFYTNYVPNASGDRTAGPHQNVCCNEIQEIRMSWTNPSHDMRFIRIRASTYGWEGTPAHTWVGYDQYLYHYSWYYVAGGCQNPAPLSTVWVNCRLGNG
jgi:hypothetical protein